MTLMVVVMSEGTMAMIYMIVIFSVLIPLLVLVMIKKNAPEAFLLWKCRRKRVPVIMVHYPEGNSKLYAPKIIRDNPEVSTPYFVVKDCGIKFRNPDGRKTERLNSDVPCIHYFVDSPEPVSTFDVVALDQLKDFFKIHGYDLTSVEDLAMYVLSEYERTGSIDFALSSAQISNDELKSRLIEFLKYVEANKNEIVKLKLKSGPFTYKTATSVIDNTIAYNSSNVSHLKSVLEAKMRHQLSNPTGDILKYGIFVMILCIAAGSFIMLTRG